jgi:hypothetical protein
MLVFKDIQDKDMINNFIEKEDLPNKFQSDGNYFACIEDDNVIGLSKINIKSNKLILDFIHFTDESFDLELASALLKSLLFKLESLNYKELISLEASKLLDDLGFRLLDGEYKLILEEFLVSDCSCGSCKNE